MKNSSTLRTKTALLAVLLGSAAVANAAYTIVNPWSGVTGDRGNMSAFAFKADAGNYPASITPADSLTPTFSLGEMTLLRPNDVTTPVFGTGVRQTTDANTPVFLDIYTTAAAGNVFSGYVGSSSSSVTWSSTTQDGAYTFSFTGITLDSATKYWFVFSEDNVDGDIANFRAKLNTSGNNTTAGPGQGYLVNDLAQSVSQDNVTRDWGVAYTATVPEPSSALLGGLGLLGLLRRRRA